jgi:hypothetical protein
MAEPAADGQDAVLALLGRRETYPAQPQVTRIDTHSAIVFLAGKDVYKVKRAVRMPFLDYSTLERRRAACEAEVRVNAGFAPEIYLGTLPVTQAENGELVLGGGGRPVEWLVHMRRFDETLTLDHVTDRGELTPKLIAELARLVLASHERAPPGDGPAALERLWRLTSGRTMPPSAISRSFFRFPGWTLSELPAGPPSRGSRRCCSSAAVPAMSAAAMAICTCATSS